MLSHLRRPARLLAMLAIPAVVSSEAPAHAASDDEACFAAATDGQRDRNQGRLLAAKAHFASCTRVTCDAKVVERCAGWLAEVAELTPSVVFSAQDDAGRDLVDVVVLLDGAPSDAALRGLATPLDPGLHTVRFVARGGAVIEQSVVLREREKARLVRAVFPRTRADDPSGASAAARPVPPSVYVFAGVGVVAAVAATVFAVRGLDDRDTFGCSSACSAEEARTTRRELLAADVAGGVAVLALGAATWFYLTRPSEPRGLQLSAQPSTNGAAAFVSGAF